MSKDAVEGDLRATLCRAHDEAARLLEDVAGRHLEAVVWLSAHIAAFEHAIYPVAKRRLPEGAKALDQDREVVARLNRTLRITERLHSGDVLAANLSSQLLRERLSELVAEYRDAQLRIVGDLEKALDPAELSYLATSYADALAHAPTRPHPHLHNALMFRLDALRDKILDTMDGRHVPVPRVARRKIIPGRWGSYLLGQPHQEPAATDEPDAT
jgi:hypothetical protein